MVGIISLMTAVTPCWGQDSMTRKDALAWVESRGGELSFDFQAIGVKDPDPAGVAVVNLDPGPLAIPTWITLTPSGPCTH